MWSHIRYGVSRPTKRPSPSRPGHDGETVRQQKHRVRKTRSSGAAPACPGDGYPSILPWRADAAGGLVDEHDRMLLVGVAGAGRGRFSASWRLENRPRTAALRTSVRCAIIGYYRTGPDTLPNLLRNGPTPGIPREARDYWNSASNWVSYPLHPECETLAPQGRDHGQRVSRRSCRRGL